MFGARAMVLLRFTSPGLRAPREGPLLAAGLGLGALLSLGLWGVRLPVLIGALLPAGAAVLHWRGERRRQTARLLNGDLLDPRVLEARLVRLAGRGLRPGAPLHHWWQVTRLLEEIRALMAACVRLVPGSAVPLLVHLEDQLDALEPLLAHLQQRGHPACSSPPQLCEHLDRLRGCRHHLQCLLEQAQREARRQPDGAVGLSLDSLA